MRRTISNLSRELGVSRPRIYRGLERLGIAKRAGGEYTLTEWEALKKELSGCSGANRQKKEDAEKVKTVQELLSSMEVAEESPAKIRHIEAATLSERLTHAKQEYDYNKNLILRFQEETDAYFRLYQRTTMTTHNGTLTAIPSIVSLDKYVKLNISLSKLISDLERDLDLETQEDGDVFG